MREIKFRAWVFNERMEEIEAIIDGKPMWYDPESGWANYNDDAILMWSTGLKDKNGVEIYEGDQLKCEDLYVTVKWEGVGWHFISDDNKDISFPEYTQKQGDWEVIGNIYENPELLVDKS